MEKDVLIKVTGLQMVEETNDSVEMMARGKHYIRNKKHYLIYEELEDENQQSVKNVIKFNDSMAEISRQGMINAKLIFEKEKVHQSLYGTPFGDLLIEVETKDIRLNEQPSNIDLEVDYAIYAHNSKVSDSKIKIEVSTD